MLLNFSNYKNKQENMVNQTLSQPLTPNLVNTVQQLSTSLQAIQPSDNQTTQLITYALVATAITGILVYHYIKNQEAQ
jgi:hypothetical protein